MFGISATRPEQMAQDIRLIAPHVDYVSPMVYPSHWGPGEYDVADPVRQPADIVRASITDFQHVVAGSGAAVVPWLQDFSAGGVTYGPVEVRAQIDAALAAGAGGFLLWNSGSFYTAQALEPARVRVRDVTEPGRPAGAEPGGATAYSLSTPGGSRFSVADGSFQSVPVNPPPEYSACTSGGSRFSVADGSFQSVRGGAANWAASRPPSEIGCTSPFGWPGRIGWLGSHGGIGYTGSGVTGPCGPLGTCGIG